MKGNFAEIETLEGMALIFPIKELVPTHPLEKEMENLPASSLSSLEKDYSLPEAKVQNPGLVKESEFDLHIEELGVSYRHLSHTEIIKLQLSFFDKKLNQSIQNRQSPIVFIHGVGSGILRQEIHKKLTKNPFVSYFLDKGKDKRGFGATEVFLKFL